MSSKSSKNGMFIGIAVVVALGALLLWWMSTGVAIAPSGTSATSTVPATTGSKPTKPVSRFKPISTSMDVATIVANLPEATSFHLYFDSTGVDDSLTGSGTYTVFVPSNAAIAQLKTGTISALPSAEKKRFVQYHVISGRAVDADALVAGQIRATSGDLLNFNFAANGVPLINSSRIVATYRGVNGIVYIVDQVLFPPKGTII